MCRYLCLKGSTVGCRLCGWFRAGTVVLVLAVSAVCWPALVVAQPNPASQPASSSPDHPMPSNVTTGDVPAAGALPPEVAEALEQVRDFELSFSQPGFYAVLAWVKRVGVPTDGEAAQQVTDWRDLLERPAEFRGRAVTIEGIVGRNKSWRLLEPRWAWIGTVSQLELYDRQQPVAATVILTEPGGDIPVGSVVRLRARFVMVRQYYDRDRRLRPALLLVGDAPLSITQTAARPAAHNRWLAGVMVAVVAALVLVWVLVRRAAAGAPAGETLPTRGAEPPMNLAEDLARWAQHEHDLAQPPAERQPEQR